MSRVRSRRRARNGAQRGLLKSRGIGPKGRAGARESSRLMCRNFPGGCRRCSREGIGFKAAGQASRRCERGDFGQQFLVNPNNALARLGPCVVNHVIVSCWMMSEKSQNRRSSVTPDTRRWIIHEHATINARLHRTSYVRSLGTAFARTKPSTAACFGKYGKIIVWQEYRKKEEHHKQADQAIQGRSSLNTCTRLVPCCALRDVPSRTRFSRQQERQAAHLMLTCRHSPPIRFGDQ